MRFSKSARCLMCFVLSLLLASGCDRLVNRSSPSITTVAAPILNSKPLAGQDLVPLARPGPWPHITELIGYGDRLWFANSVAFENHNSADLYSYAPDTGQVRYERHLFSQSVGQPVVADGLLYWPFEDPRFSTDLGEYMVTNGDDWQWHLLAEGEAFHVHAMTAYEGSLFAGTGAWAGRLQRSHDGGQTWEVIYEYPTPRRQVSRMTELTVHNEQLYVGVTALQEDSIKLFRWEQETLRPVPTWPKGKRVTDLTTYGGWLYGINIDSSDRSTVWHTQGEVTEPVTELDGYLMRAFSAGPDALWAVGSYEGDGFLWQSSDGITWTAVHRFPSMRPLDVAVYAGNVYVGGQDAEGQGVLLGPAGPTQTEAAIPKKTPMPQTVSLSLQQVQRTLQQFNEVMTTGSSYRNGDTQTVLSQALKSLALSGAAEAGETLSQYLDRSPPQATAQLFGGNVSESALDVLRWYLLWAIALNGHGRIPVELLATPWTIPSNSPEKYWQPTPAAAWAIAQLQQADAKTLNALINRLSFEDDPMWLKGDFVGALSALTGEQFGYDEAAWQSWWAQQANDSSTPALLQKPG